MDLIALSEQLKAVQDQFLEQQVSNPSGTVPPYLVLSELNRRKTLRSQMAQPPTSTVAQDVLQQPPPMMPQQQGLGGVDMLNQQMPQPQMPQVPQGGMPMGGGLAAMAPPMPQGPQAPQRMAGGGLIGTGEDRFIGGPKVFRSKHWGDDVQRFQTGGLTRGGGYGYLDFNNPLSVDRLGTPAYYNSYGSSRRPQARVVRLPGGGWKYEVDDKEFEISGRPTVKFPDYRESDPITVPRPKLEEFLGEVRAITADPEGYVSPLDKRISELETQRSKIRRPGISQGLFETGLAMMASKSPTLAGAIGEGASGAFSNVMRGRDAADRMELGITDRLAGIEAQREEQKRRQRMEDLRAASDLAQRQHGANMVEAQLRGQREGDRRTYDLKRFDAENAAATAAWAPEVQLQMKALEQGLKPPELTWQQKQENELAQIKARADQQIRVDAARPHYGSGYGAYGRAIPQAAIEGEAERILKEEALKWRVGGEDDLPTYMERLRSTLSDEIRSGKRYGDVPMSPQTRMQLANMVRNRGFDPKKPDDKDFLGLVTDYVEKGKAAALAEGAKNTPAGFGGMPASKGGQAVMDIVNRYAPAAAPATEKAGEFLGGLGEYTPWNFRRNVNRFSRWLTPDGLGFGSPH